MKKKGRKRVKVGNVHAIPLPDGRYAFGRMFRDGAIGIYKDTGDTIEDLPDEEKYQFIVFLYDDVLTSGDWPVICSRPFSNSEEEWPPPTFIEDQVSEGKYSIYYKEEILSATRDECIGLEETSVWDSNHIIDRIMGDNTWHRFLE